MRQQDALWGVISLLENSKVSSSTGSNLWNSHLSRTKIPIHIRCRIYYHILTWYSCGSKINFILKKCIRLSRSRDVWSYHRELQGTLVSSTFCSIRSYTINRIIIKSSKIHFRTWICSSIFSIDCFCSTVDIGESKNLRFSTRIEWRPWISERP